MLPGRKRECVAMLILFYCIQWDAEHLYMQVKKKHLV